MKYLCSVCLILIVVFICYTRGESGRALYFGYINLAEKPNLFYVRYSNKTFDV